jgi:CDP-diacylglycerol--glycerol-3-phosphate 3-phosphatidyltransferase
MNVDDLPVEEDWYMFPDQFDSRIRLFTDMIVTRTLARTSLSANRLTILGSVMIFGSIYLLASGAFFWAGCLILSASIFDMLDGAVARVKNEISRFGAFLDSTLDRYSEAFVFFGLLLYYHQVSHASNELVLIYITIAGSFLISYIRARAEALGFDCKVGLLERPQRIILVVVGLLLGWISIMLWILAILTHVTALQRLIYVWRQSQIEKTNHHSSGPNRTSAQESARLLR